MTHRVVWQSLAKIGQGTLKNLWLEKKIKHGQTRMWADAQRDVRPANYRWRPLRKFSNFIPCTTPQSAADARCWNVVQ